MGTGSCPQFVKKNPIVSRTTLPHMKNQSIILRIVMITYTGKVKKRP